VAESSSTNDVGYHVVSRNTNEPIALIVLSLTHARRATKYSITVTSSYVFPCPSPATCLPW